MIKETVFVIIGYCWITFANAQSVGIGETSPAAKLEIKSSTQFYGGLALHIKNSISAPLMNIRDNGFTGIGTAVPGARLHLKDDFEVLRIEGNSPYISFYDGTGTYKGYLWENGTSSIQLGSAAGSGLPITIAPNGTADAYFSQGYTGIGNSNPSYRLDVSGRIRIRYGFESAGIWFNNSTNTSPAGFVGMYDDSFIGIYGAPYGWFFLANTGTGNASIGGNFPTSARLSVYSPFVALEAGTTTLEGSAISIYSGYLSVRAAGINSNTTAFVHKATSANTPFASGYTVIDNPVCNGQPDLILNVTMNGTYGTGVLAGYEVIPEVAATGGSCQLVSPTSFMIFYNGPNNSTYASSPVFARNKWCIKTYTGCVVSTPTNFNFNVLVIKPL